MILELRPGDIFCTSNPQALGKLITLAEWLPWRDGHKGKYSHAGIITDECGNTVEELWTLCANNLDAYTGKDVLILRWSGMTLDAFSQGMTVACKDLYEPYPFWRLSLMLIPQAAHIISNGKWAVCSERVTQFLLSAGWPGTDTIRDWRDIDPQAIADLAWRPSITRIFEGTWKGIK